VGSKNKKPETRCACVGNKTRDTLCVCAVRARGMIEGGMCMAHTTTKQGHIGEQKTGDTRGVRWRGEENKTGDTLCAREACAVRGEENKNQKHAVRARGVRWRAGALSYYIDRPVEFTRDILRAEPDAAQAKVMNSVARNRMTSVRSGHGVGKSALEAWLILWFLCTRPYPKIPCTAPTKHQLYDILWAEVAKWLRGSAVKDQLVWSYEKVYLKGEPENWFAVPRAAAQPDALQGFHAEHLLFVVDEASGVDDRIFEPVLGALSTPDARLLLCGNPTNLTGFFFDSHNKKRELYETFRISGEDSPRVSREYIRMVEEMYGRDSDVYRVRVAGEFPRAMPDSLIPLDAALGQCVKKPERTARRRIDMGVDVARFGDDESVIATVFDGVHQQENRVFSRLDTMALAGRVAGIVREYAEEFPGARIRVKVDCDGLGAGVYDRLCELKLPAEIVECHFGGKGGRVEGEPVEMKNAAAVMWGNVRRRIMQGELYLAEDEAQIVQLTNRRYRVASDGRIELERKEEMKRRGVSSPDRADALALALYEPPRAGEFLQVLV